MNNILLQITIAVGIFASLLFIGGYARGIGDTLRDHRAQLTGEAEVTPQEKVGKGYGIKIAAAVVAAAVGIALAGVHPWFIYLGPALTLISAAGIGLAFFVDRH